MDSDSDSDEYDYLTVLKSGFDTNVVLKTTSIPVISSVDTDSDTYDDSDDCVIVEVKRKSDQSVDKCDDKHEDNSTPTKSLNQRLTDLVSKKSTSNSVELKTKETDENFDSITKDIENLKNVSEVSNLKPLAPLKTESIDAKPDNKLDVKPHDWNHLKNEWDMKDIKLNLKCESNDIKPDIKPPDWDFKPFVLKTENGVKCEESFELDLNESIDNLNTSIPESTDTNEESIKSNDNVSNDLNEANLIGSKKSTSTDDRFDVLLALIEANRSQHQRSTFDRLLAKYKRRTDICFGSDPISSLNLLIKDAIERKLIEEVDGSDSIVFYRIVNTQMKRRRMSSSSKESSRRKETDCTPKKRKLCEEEEDDSNLITDFNHNIPSKLESLAIEGYTDISDIDLSSAQELFGDYELNPEIFVLYEVPIKESPTSFSFSSTPIKSFNHNRNQEVIRKKSWVPSSSTKAEELDKMLSLKDYRDWLLEPLPRYSPFIAQQFDRVVYLRDAHQIYMEYELKVLRELYPKFHSTPEEIETAINGDDYVLNVVICDVKFYQINYIKFTVIKLKSLSIAKPFEFSVLYRPNRGICDFLVLESLYKESQTVEWKSGQEFRSLWKKSWWIGTVVDKCVFDPKYPNSLFKSYKIKWNTGEKGKLSPWDLFAIDMNRMPKRKENGVLITREDMLKINYKASFNEWPEVYGLEMDLWRCHECKRIFNAIRFLKRNVCSPIISIFMECKNQEITYPITIELIKQRLQNLFYRRKDSIIRDINFLKTNSKLNVKKSDFKNCEDFVDLLLDIVNDCQSTKDQHFCIHLNNKFSHLKKVITHEVKECPPVSTLEQSSVLNIPVASSSSMPKLPNQSTTQQKSAKKKTSRNRSAPDTSKSVVSSDSKVTESIQWKTDTQKFIDQFLKNDDSLPYRQPVDPILFPHYKIVIANPIDLSIIQRKLTLDEYPNPIHMRKDFRLMFENAKAFSRDPKCKMRVINKNLSHLVEDRLREIIVDWERVYSYEQKIQKTKGSKVREPISRNQLWGYGYQQYY